MITDVTASGTHKYGDVTGQNPTEYIKGKHIEGRAGDYTLARTTQHPVTVAGCDTARKTKNSSSWGAIIC